MTMRAAMVSVLVCFLCACSSRPKVVVVDFSAGRSASEALPLTFQSTPIKVTVTNPSAKSHSLRIFTSVGEALVDAQVPSCAYRRPSVWKTFDLDPATKRLIVVVDGETTVVKPGQDVQEIVIDVGQGAPAVQQHDAPIPWR